MTAAAIVANGPRLRIERYDATTGRLLASAPVQAGAQDVDIAEGVAVYRIGNAIHVFTRVQPALLARTAATPIGLSIAGHRVAWAENVRGHGRIQSVTLR